MNQNDFTILKTLVNAGAKAKFRQTYNISHLAKKADMSIGDVTYILNKLQINGYLSEFSIANGGEVIIVEMDIKGEQAVPDVPK